MATSSQKPRISVIIPVHNAATDLRRCLSDLRKSTCRSYECLVVDDASTDESAEVANRYGCRVVPLSRQSGPAAARNRGATEARGSILLFIDSDISVAPNLLSSVAACFEQDPSIDAVIGSYDDAPEHPGFVSQYKNLAHHFVHQSGNSSASTFWSGCGAIRKEVFSESRGFNERYERPAIEDIELGYRLKAQRRRILLDKSMRVKHLKKWTFASMVKTDIFDRGIPWTELILEYSNMPSELNLHVSQRISVVLVFLTLLSFGLLTSYVDATVLYPLPGLLLLSLAAYSFYRSNLLTTTKRNVAWCIIILPTVLLFVLWYQANPLILSLIVVLAVTFREHRLVDHRTNRPFRQFSCVASGAVTIGVALYILTFIPSEPIIILPLSLLAAVILINRRFYTFLIRHRGIWFMVAAFPLHVLYYLYSGLCFVAGTFAYWWKRQSRVLGVR